MERFRLLWLLFAYLSLLQNTIFAVECPSPSPPREELNKVDAVFSGEVVDQEYRDETIKDNRDELVQAKQSVFKFKVENWWKGGDAETVLVATLMYKLADGSGLESGESPRFAKGSKYSVYAFRSKEIFGASDCTRTKLLIRAENDLRELGEGNMPKKSLNGNSKTTN